MAVNTTMKITQLSRSLLALLAGAVLVTAPGAVCAQGVKIGSVSLEKLYGDFYKTKIARKTFEDSVSVYRKDRQQRIDDFNKLNDEYQKLREEAASQALTQEKRDLKTKASQEKLLELRKANQAIQEFEQSSQQFLSDQQRRQNTAIMKEVLEAVRKKARDGAYTVIVDSSGLSSAGIPAAVYADEKLDITDLVLKDLNANAPANLPASSTSGSAPAPSFGTPSTQPPSSGTKAPTPPPPPLR
jgi:Skp family chaperone for outer membrane proteins